tara:strand:- start:267 stop:1094 length:828 start_codon:yes stop_codon:yes gene_type:complete
MKLSSLIEQIKLKKSYLCVGIDPDLEKIPGHIRNQKDPIYTFSKSIIDSTVKFAVAFKFNIAFFEAYGIDGLVSLEKLIKYVNKQYPDVFTIADAKRGDIGNSSSRYAKAFFEGFGFDSITVSPYMGRDSIEPFLSFENRHTIILALTSNSGAEDFQFISSEGKKVYEHVIVESKKWNGNENIMYVVGATKSTYLENVRKLIPDSFLLIPGVGTQGGSLEEVSSLGINKNIGILVNSSRAIIYASNEGNFAEKAAAEAKNLQVRMELILKNKQII